MQASQELVALVFSSFLNLGCAPIRHTVHESIEYQKGLEVVYTDPIPGEGVYDVFVDTRTNACAVDFTPSYSPLSRDTFYRSFSNPLYPQHPDLSYEEELLEKYCPKQERTPSPPLSSLSPPQSL